MDNKEFTNKIVSEVKWWHILGWSTPIVALGVLFFLEMIGWSDFLHKGLVIGASVFFAVAVFWWWWAIARIAGLAKALFLTTNKLEGIKQALQDLKNDLGNRQR